MDWILWGVYIILYVCFLPVFYGHSNDSSPFSPDSLLSIFHAFRVRVVHPKGVAPVAFCDYCAFVLVGLVVMIVDLDDGFGSLEGCDLRGDFGVVVDVEFSSLEYLGLGLLR